MPATSKACRVSNHRILGDAEGFYLADSACLGHGRVCHVLGGVGEAGKDEGTLVVEQGLCCRHCHDAIN